MATEVVRLKATFEGRLREMEQREARMQEQERERALEELQVKYLALLEGQGLLEESDGQGNQEG